ncbi:hypothetical protein [Pelosinus sp. IPA-1]|nr:hypothetical protein [Pelosinus sp. IPA-1]
MFDEWNKMTVGDFFCHNKKRALLLKRLSRLTQLQMMFANLK